MVETYPYVGQGFSIVDLLMCENVVSWCGTPAAACTIRNRFPKYSKKKKIINNLYGSETTLSSCDHTHTHNTTWFDLQALTNHSYFFLEILNWFVLITHIWRRRYTRAQFVPISYVHIRECMYMCEELAT